MFVLMIVILAVLALWLSNRDRKHPAALFLLGVMCVGLGGRAAGLLSDVYSDKYVAAVYADESKDVLGEISSDSEFSVTATADDAVTSVSSSTGPRQLTIEPTTGFRYLTTPRPDWLETEATSNDQGYQVAVESGLHVRKRTAQQSLRDAVKATVDAYVNDCLNSEMASTLCGYSIEEHDRGTARTIDLRLGGKSFEIAGERFDEQVEFDYGVMNQSHALVKLDQNVKAALDERWNKVRAVSRLFQAGLGAGAVLLLLGTMFSYLKLDTATRGYYTGRLQFGAAAAILAIVAAGVVCANWIPWM